MLLAFDCEPFLAEGRSPGSGPPDRGVDAVAAIIEDTYPPHAHREPGTCVLCSSLRFCKVRCHTESGAQATHGVTNGTRPSNRRGGRHAEGRSACTDEQPRSVAELGMHRGGSCHLIKVPGCVTCGSAPIDLEPRTGNAHAADRVVSGTPFDQPLHQPPPIC